MHVILAMATLCYVKSKITLNFLSVHFCLVYQKEHKIKDLANLRDGGTQLKLFVGDFFISFIHKKKHKQNRVAKKEEKKWAIYLL